MKNFVFWTGIYNIVAALLLGCPWLDTRFGFNIPDSYFWVFFPAQLLLFKGAILIVSSRRLETRASIVCWEGISRIIGSSIMMGYFFKDFGFMIILLGIIDWLIAFFYFIGLSKYFKTPFISILFDKYAGG